MAPIGGSLRSRSSHLIVGLVVLAFVVAAVPAAAQILYGSVVGVVKDSTGAFIPGATVTIVNKETNLTREATTSGEGAYSLIALGIPRRRAAERPDHDRPDCAHRLHPGDWYCR